MFTFGMFTSHIPYIALVAFYAYFVLFGMEKASKGEILSESRNTFIYEIQVSDSFNEISSGCFYYHSEDLFAEQSKFENFVFKRKLSRIGFDDNLHYRFIIVPSTANRPPPVVA